MPYKLGDRILPLDVAWEHDGVQYPANWLRLSTAQDRAQLGIVWEASNTANWDQGFYWGYDADGNLIPKDYAQLNSLWIDTTKRTANTMLQPSDWMVVRESETGVVAPAEWTTWRATIRTECGTKIAAIEETANVGDTSPYPDLGRVEALQQYIRGGNYHTWTASPDSQDPE